MADDILFVRQLVLSGAGLGLIPMFVGASAAERTDMVRVLPAWVLRVGAFHVVAPSARHEPRRVRLFRDFLVGEARRRGFGA